MIDDKELQITALVMLLEEKGILVKNEFNKLYCKLHNEELKSKIDWESHYDYNHR
jgi:hypothetical protein